MEILVPKKRLLEGSHVSFDTETTGIRIWHGDRAFAFSFCNEVGESKYFEFDVDPFTRRVIPDKLALKHIASCLMDESITKVMHNGKFDVRVMERGYNILVAGPGGLVRDGGHFDETMFMAFNCHTREPNLKLKDLSQRYCGFPKEDQDLLQKCVVSLRRKAKKLGWAIGQKIQLEPEGESKVKAEPHTDYWIPGSMRRRHPDLCTEEQADLCRVYAVGDVERTMLLRCLYEELMDELDVRGMYNLEMELWPVIYGMEDRGVCTNPVTFDRQMEEARKEVHRLRAVLDQKAWPGFRPKAPDDCRKLFFEKLGMVPTKWTPGGKYGLNKQPAVSKFFIIDHIDHPVVRDVAIYKSNHTAFTGFFSKYRELSIPDPLNSAGTALHCDYRQVGAKTGRLSSGNPNLQNVMTPENTMAVHPLHVRPGFEPRPGYWWLCVDYEGMEVRMFALLSHEPTMMKAIHAGRSIHDEMTDTIWGGKGNYEAIRQAIRALSLDGTGIGTSPEVDALWRGWGVTAKNVLSITPTRREELADLWLASHNYSQVRAQSAIGRKNSKTTIKSLTFLKIYGGGAEKATYLLRVPREEAAKTLKLYDDKFPRINEYSQDLIGEAKANGFIRSVWGRRLMINQDKPYQAVNYVIQGSSADLMKSALIRVNRYYQEAELDAHIQMTIHDEIISEVRIEEMTKRLIREKCRIMSDSEGRLALPMTVEPKVVTENWSIKRKVKY
jgi:DNA polymerase I-like protein with 3'-5' exonuclease and polymerase domains